MTTTHSDGQKLDYILAVALVVRTTILIRLMTPINYARNIRK